MAEPLGTVEVEISAGELVAGDVLCLPGGLRRRVLDVRGFVEELGPRPGARLRVLVSGGTSQAWEGARSGHRGASAVQLDAQGLRPFLPDELVVVERELDEL